MRSRTWSTRLADRHRGGVTRSIVLQAGEREALEGPVGADEVGHEVVDRVGQEIGGRRELHQPPVAHDGDPVGHLHGLVDVVADEDDGLGNGPVQAQEVVLQPLAGDRVDGRERLVHQHHRRVGRQRAGEADALLLAARELGRVAARELVGVEPDQLQQLADAAAGPLLVPPEQLRHGGHVGADGEVGEEADLLDDVADLAAQRGRVAARARRGRR